MVAAIADGLDGHEDRSPFAGLPVGVAQAQAELAGALAHVIEHLVDPHWALQRVNSLLKPGGLLVVHTIDIESLFARLMGPRWPWLMEMHIYYFSRQTLRAMLNACGFRVLSDKPQGRFLRLGYLMNRVGALVPPVGRPAEWLVTKLGLRGQAVPVNLGDLFTAYARKR